MKNKLDPQEHDYNIILEAEREIKTLCNDFDTLAWCYDSLMRGDTMQVEDAFKLLRKYNLVDENDEWIYTDED